MLQLFRGINAVVYGYIFSSIVYFYAYAKIKKYFYSGAWPDTIQIDIDNKTEIEEIVEINQNRDLVKHLSYTFVAASIAEALSLLFYYPYDLIKTRM